MNGKMMSKKDKGECLQLLKGMDLIVLHMANKIQGQRSLAGCFHILTGKKSGQAIQDATLFGYQPWFGLYPDVNRSEFDSMVQEMVLREELHYQNNSILISEMGKQRLIDEGNKIRFFDRALLLQNYSIHIPKIKLFWNKLQLLGQVISFYLADQPQYSPQIMDLSIQRWLKKFWSSLSDKQEYIVQFQKEMKQFLTQMEDPLFAHLLLSRFSGYQVNALTLQQLSMKYQIPEAITRLYLFQALGLLYISIEDEKFSTLMPLILEMNSEEDNLTKSTAETLRYLKKGLSLEQISKVRGLKSSTIEDHIVEIAIQIPDFDLSNFIHSDLIDLVIKTSERLRTKKMRLIKEEIGEGISYLQIRLALIRGVNK